MLRSFVAPVSAVLGGALWILHPLVGPAGDPLPQALLWTGLALVLLATAVGAAELVTGDVLALRLLVAVAAPLLVWSVMEFFRPDASGPYVAAWGTFAVVAGTWRLRRDRRSPAPPPRPARRAPTRRAHPRGAHAR